MDIWKIATHFKPSEFHCPCGCNKAPKDMDETLLWILEAVRLKYGKPVQITSGYRCREYNAKTAGSSSVSRHMLKKAADFYIQGQCDTLIGRKDVMAFMKTLPNFNYTYCNENGSHRNMGKAIHVEVK